MKYHPTNIFAALLASTALILLLRYRHQVDAFFSMVKRIGPGNSPEDMTLGVIVTAFCGVALIAIVRLLTNNRNH